MACAAAVAEELPELLLVERDPVPLDQRDEIARRVTRERGTAEIRVLRKIAGRARADIREVAASAAGDADLLAEPVIVLDEEHAATALPRLRRAHHAGGAGADHDDVVGRRRGRALCYGPKKSRTLSMNDLARGLCAPGSLSLMASNSRSSSFCRAVSLTGVSSDDVAVEVARHRAPDRPDALVAQPEHLPALRLRRDLDLRVPFERRNLDLAAQRRDGEADRHFAVQVRALALEDRVRLQVDDDVEIAGRAAVHSGLALAGEPDPVVLVDARGDLHRQRLVLLDAPGAVARGTGVGDDLAGPVAGRARLLDREEALRHPHFAAPVARRALLGLRSGFRAAAMARLARLVRGDADLRLGAPRRILQAELEVVPEVGAAIDAVAAAAPPRCAPKISPKMSPNASEKPPNPSGPAPRAPPSPPTDRPRRGRTGRRPRVSWHR